MRDTKGRKDNKSGYAGVTQYRDGVRWVVQIRYGGRNHYLGIYDTKSSAVEARRLAVAKLDVVPYQEVDKWNKH